jgi:O-antigen/teichoic acid export membrane protein
LDQVGLYAVANSLTSVLAYVYGALGQAWSPRAYKVYTEQPEEAPKVYGHVLTYVLLAFGILSVGFTSFAPEVLVLLSTPKFYPAATAVGPLALGFVAYASTQVTAAGISITKRTNYITVYSWIAALLNLGLNVWLIPIWGMMASSWATAMSYVFLTVAYAITTQKLYPLVYEKWRSGLTIVLTVAFTIAAPLLPDLGLIGGILLKAAYCLSFVAALFAFRVLDQREWVPLREMVERMLGRRTVEAT